MSLFPALNLNARAQPVRRVHTPDRRIEESVTYLSPPSPRSDDHELAPTPPVETVRGPPPAPPPPPAAAPDLTEWQQRVSWLQTRLEALDRSDARTKTHLAQLKDQVTELRGSLDQLADQLADEIMTRQNDDVPEPWADQQQKVQLALAAAEERCRQYCDAALAGALHPEPEEPEEADSDNAELTVEERHARQWPTRRQVGRVLCGFLSVAVTPLMLVAYYTTMGVAAGQTPEDAFYSGWGGTAALT